ncbi:MAG: hypothetical protein EPO26_07960 [Chloroflexota bacterium]|nr:MAG: hypothetical protein EPO26_07960 [Chloroflexota bacterium]
MKFWDASAVVELVASESRITVVEDVLVVDPAMAVWWGTPIECRSALARRHRQGQLSVHDIGVAQRAVDAYLGRAQEIGPTLNVRDRALRLVDVHELRATAALQLAAALAWARERPAGVGFVCLDRRLRAAAGREGFDLLPNELALARRAPPAPMIPIFVSDDPAFAERTDEHLTGFGSR